MQTTCLLPSRDAQPSVSGPLSGFRRRPIEARSPAVRKPIPGERTAWTVDHMPDAPLVGTLEEAAEVARFFNEWARPDGSPMAVPKMVKAVEHRPAPKYPGCETVEVDVPADLWKVFTERCDRTGIDPSRLVAAMILTHCQNRQPDNFGDGMVRNLAAWESSRKRKVCDWPEAVAAE